MPSTSPGFICKSHHSDGVLSFLDLVPHTSAGCDHGISGAYHISSSGGGLLHLTLDVVCPNVSGLKGQRLRSKFSGGAVEPRFHMWLRIDVDTAF